MFIVSIRLTLDLWNDLAKKVEEKVFPSMSEALRSYCILGLKIESFKHSIKDPEFMKSINDLKKGNAIFEWFHTLSNDEIEAMSLAAQLEKESRVKQEKFL